MPSIRYLNIGASWSPAIDYSPSSFQDRPKLLSDPRRFPPCAVCLTFMRGRCNLADWRKSNTWRVPSIWDADLITSCRWATFIDYFLCQFQRWTRCSVTISKEPRGRGLEGKFWMILVETFDTLNAAKNICRSRDMIRYMVRSHYRFAPLEYVF